MSQENVELHRRAIDAFNRRDWEAFVALMHDEVEAEPRIVAIEGGFHGHEGLRRWWNDFLGVFPDYFLELEETRALGDVTLTRFRTRARGAASNAPLDAPAWQAIRWQDGKCTWWRVCSTEAEALKAAGLRE